jgi:predicted Rossmann-fold nucleotide-binding protein
MAVDWLMGCRRRRLEAGGEVIVPEALVGARKSRTRAAPTVASGMYERGGVRFTDSPIISSPGGVGTMDEFREAIS